MASDGRELYVFDSRGRHLRSVDAVGGVQLYAFSYDAWGRLSTVTDRNDQVTTIERDASADITAIAAPPQLSVMAFAIRTAHYIADNLKQHS